MHRLASEIAPAVRPEIGALDAAVLNPTRRGEISVHVTVFGATGAIGQLIVADSHRRLRGVLRRHRHFHRAGPANIAALSRISIAAIETMSGATSIVLIAGTAPAPELDDRLRAASALSCR